MKRPYESQMTDDATFFVGIEIEKTQAYGMKTLFVVGLQDPNEIRKKAKEHDCHHIFFGANHSFDISDSDELMQWKTMITNFLDDGYWCSLDFEIHQNENVLEMCLSESNLFIPIIGLRVKSWRSHGYHAVLKLSDIDFNASNEGVWCHRIHDLMTKDSFTSWDEYNKDKKID